MGKYKNSTVPCIYTRSWCMCCYGLDCKLTVTFMGLHCSAPCTSNPHQAVDGRLSERLIGSTLQAEGVTAGQRRSSAPRTRIWCSASRTSQASFGHPTLCCSALVQQSVRPLWKVAQLRRLLTPRYHSIWGDRLWFAREHYTRCSGLTVVINEIMFECVRI